MKSNGNETQTWPELAIQLYDKLTGRGAEINYQMDQLMVEVPAGTAAESPRAKWVINGGLRISTRDTENN